MGYFRSPHTMNERRANQDPRAQPSRRPQNLPTATMTFTMPHVRIETGNGFDVRAIAY